MNKFSAFIVERSKSFKSYLEEILGQSGISTTSSSRHGYHIRFPMKGSLKEFNNFFKKYGIRVEDADSSISGQFPSYIISVDNKIPSDFNVGEEIIWVNNYVGEGSKSAKIFNTKDLTPNKLNLAGNPLSARQIIDIASLAINQMEYSEDIKEYLIDLLFLADTQSKSSTIASHIEKFSSSDYATLSKDFGEVLSAVWALKNLPYKMALFPSLESEKLIDFYLMNSQNDKIAISVKSGAGSKITIVNILDAIIESGKMSEEELQSETAYKIFDIVKNYSAKEAMVELHKEMKTDAIKMLGKIIGINWKSITIQDIKMYVESKTNLELKGELSPFLNSLNTTITDKIWSASDKLRFIISPLGESIWKILNDSAEIKSSLNRLAKQLNTTQINVDVTKNRVTFDINEFKDAQFQFGWAGYIAGNKLGFKMIL